MKKQIFFFVLLLTAFVSCNDIKIGYLKAENAEYIPNTLQIRTELDPVKDKVRIENDAPWVTLKMVGVLGTDPIIYSLIEVTASEGGDAEIFKKELIVLGRGIMQMPLRPQSPKGKYVVSLRLQNEGYSADIKDAYTFTIE